MAMFVFWASLGCLAALLAVAAWGDARRFIIPNWLCGAVALLSVPHWWASGGAFWPGFAIQAGLALAVFALFAALFMAGMMGGGDVKLLAALALWLPLPRLVEMLTFVALAGGVLTIGLLARHRFAARSGHLEVPYGLAIVVGAFAVLGEPLVKQFQS